MLTGPYLVLFAASQSTQGGHERICAQAGAEILIDDFDPEAQAQQAMRQKAADAERHAQRMLQQTKVRHKHTELCAHKPCTVLAHDLTAFLLNIYSPQYNVQLACCSRLRCCCVITIH